MSGNVECGKHWTILHVSIVGVGATNDDRTEIDVMKARNILMHHVSPRVGPEQPNTFHNRSPICIPKCVLFDGKLICHTWQPMHGQRQGCTNSALLVWRTTIVCRKSIESAQVHGNVHWQKHLSAFLSETRHGEQPKNLSASSLISRSECSLIKIWFHLFHSIIIIIIITWQRK